MSSREALTSTNAINPIHLNQRITPRSLSSRFFGLKILRPEFKPS
jgi:hypothetical protein